MFKVLLVGGPDVDSRLGLMEALSSNYIVAAAGSSPNLYQRFAEAGFQYFYYPLARGIDPLQDLSTLFTLRQLMRQFRPHLVHTFDTKPCIWGRLAAKLAGVPAIVGTIPGLGSLFALDTVLSQVLRIIYRPLQKLASQGPGNLTVFQNPDDARQFIAEGIVTESNAVVILGSGVDINLFNRDHVLEADRNRVRADLKISAKQITVTMVSRLLRSKGVLEFAEASRLVQQKHTNVQFLLIGSVDENSQDGLTSDELERLQDTVAWPGRREDIAVILSLSDIFVLPSAYREGIPRVLLEAAAMRLPLITTDTPGCREVVQHGLNGYLVPARDSGALSEAIVRLIEHPELRKRFGTSSRRFIEEHFAFTIIASQMHNIYRELLRKSGALANTNG